MALRQILGPAVRAIVPWGSAPALSRGISICSKIQAVNVEEKLTENAPPEKHGWGQTKVMDVLKAKADRGSWLWCSKDDLVIEAIKKMTKGNVGSLLVIDPSKVDPSGPVKNAAKDAVVGIFTERDYLNKVVVQGKTSTSLCVSEIMTPQSKLMTVAPDQNVLEVMYLMNSNNFRHVPVVAEGSYLGMVSIRDLVSVMVQEHKEEVGRLNEYISGSY